MKKSIFIPLVTLLVVCFIQDVLAQGTLIVNQMPSDQSSMPTLGLGQYAAPQAGGLVALPPQQPPGISSPILVQAVPEPSALTLFAVGGGLAGFLLRRRRV